jgi:hypothetical protein
MEKELILGTLTHYVTSTHIPWLSTLAFVSLNFHMNNGSPCQPLDHPSTLSTIRSIQEHTGSICFQRLIIIPIHNNHTISVYNSFSCFYTPYSNTLHPNNRNDRVPTAMFSLALTRHSHRFENHHSIQVLILVYSNMPNHIDLAFHIYACDLRFTLSELCKLI